MKVYSSNGFRLSSDPHPRRISPGQDTASEKYQFLRKNGPGVGSAEAAYYPTEGGILVGVPRVSDGSE